MAVTCKNCGGAHAIWECKRPATKSTGAAKVAGVAPKLAHGSRNQLPVDTNPPQGSKGLSDDGREVTLQRPVEGTNSGPSGKRQHSVADGNLTTSAGTVGNEDRQPTSEPHITAGHRAPDTGVAGNHPVSRGPGEGNVAPKFDKKAWSRAYMKIWMRNKRAKLKASPGA